MLKSHPELYLHSREDLGTVQIGTPPRDFLLLMDSGSADMWVGSEDCASDDDGEEGCVSAHPSTWVAY